MASSFKKIYTQPEVDTYLNRQEAILDLPKTDLKQKDLDKKMQDEFIASSIKVQTHPCIWIYVKKENKDEKQI